MRGAVEIGVLGPVRVTVDGAPVPIGGPKAQLLVARLALSAPESVATDALIDSLWGESPPATARKILQKYISMLRERLGSDVVATEGAGYALALDTGRIDAVRFDRLRKQARAARNDGQPERAWELLAQALSLWRGRPLVGLDDVPFAAAAVAPLDEARLAAEEDQLEVGLDLGRHEALLPRIEQLSGMHPYRERLWAELMVALYRSGRQADALAAYRRVRTLLADELGIEPAPSLRALEERILRQDADLVSAPFTPATTAAANLPVHLTTFVGRSTELVEIGELLASDRLVTLLGPGGSGKTRLAVEAARRYVERFPDGVHLIDLASVTLPAAVEHAVAVPFGVDGETGRPPAAVLADYLASRAPLIVVDNCEHVAATVAELLTALLQAAPRLRLLATSREPLGVPGEVRYDVQPLPVPVADDAPDIEGYDGVRLFVERARAAQPHFRLDGANARDIAQICRRVDGIPLALELAAARVRTFGTAQLTGLLDDRFRVLASSDRPVPARHQTLRAAMDWSYALLSEPSRILFRRLSVFRGGFDLEATEEICGGAPLAPGEVRTLMPELVDKSLVVVDHRPDGTARYRMLETLREYGHQRLAPAEEADVQARHSAHFCALAERAAADLQGSEQRRWIARIGEDYANVRESCCWAVEQNPEQVVRQAVALAPYWDAVGPRLHGQECLRDAVNLSATAPPSLRIAALVAASDMFVSTEPGDSERYAAQALDEARRLGDEVSVGRALRALAYSRSLQGDHDTAIALGEEALTILSRVGDVWEAAQCLERLGQSEYQDPDRAMDYYLGSLTRYRATGDRRRVAGVLYKMAEARAQARRDLDEALDWVRESLSICAELGVRHDAAHARLALGWVLVRLTRLDEARSAFEQALEVLRKVGDQRCTARSLCGLGIALNRLGDRGRARAALQECLEVGRALDERRTSRIAIAGLAKLMAGEGRLAESATLLAVADRIGRELTLPEPPSVGAARAADLDRLRDALGESAFEAARRRGAQMPLEDAVWLALGETGPDGQWTTDSPAAEAYG